MSYRNLVIITKIILFYCIFVVGMKLILVIKEYFSLSTAEKAAVFSEMALAQTILAIPFLLLAIIAFFKNKKENYSWIFVAIGAVVIIGMRALEFKILGFLQDLFLNQ